MPLPVIALSISDSAMRDLDKNLWNGIYVPAKMKNNSKTSAVSIRYRGGHTRDYPKKSYEIVRDRRTFHYNAEFDDPSLIRNALSLAFFPMIGVPAPRTKHVRLFVNGEPKGVYLEIEGVERAFFRRRNLGISSLFYAVNNRADFGLISSESNRRKRSLLAGYEFRLGASSEKTRLKSFIKGLNVLRGPSGEAFIRSRLDADNYLRWLAGAALTGNFDGFEQNYAIYRGGKKGKFRMIPWDYEGTWGRDCYGKIVASDLVPVSGYNALTRRLLAYPIARKKYRSILREALEGPFAEKRLMPIVEDMMNGISPYVREDRTRKWTYGEFAREPLIIHDYIRARRAIVAKELGNQ
ncbi:spore coat protein CotH [Cohnella terricola]|uniref:Spore coat protein CotH n=2 Tax=Cohnella terricola TaxID=1289167 RepID=A0A559JXK5_9BACL|nr:spore coat protein CotH [Cohnella terricola]